MIYITGDTHGDYESFTERMSRYPLNRSDTVIVCGDFGFVWDTHYHRYSLAKLTVKQYTIVFIDGNHEDHALLGTYSCEQWNGGKVHRIADNIFHLMRGQHFLIEGKSFFTMGGAYSADKAMRTEGVSWWKEELPNKEEYETAEQTLKACRYKVDYVLTHTVPKSVAERLGAVPDSHEAQLQEYLEGLYTKLDFKSWFAGHFHVNMLVDDRLQVLHDQVVMIKEKTI